MDQPAVVQIVSYKNRGKTTLVSRLVIALKKQGYQVGTLKHGAHDFEMDHPGTDTWQHREAGADVVSITSDKQTAFLEQNSTSVHELLQKMGHLDFVLIEGFKTAPFPKVVIIKEESDQDLLGQLENVIAVASWVDHLDIRLPVKPIDDVDGILSVVMEDHNIE